MEPKEIVAWVIEKFNLGDRRRSRALGEMVWGLISCGKVAYAAIGRAMRGTATAASKIARVFNFCHNEHVDPRAIQAALIELLVRQVVLNETGQAELVTVSVDWHAYDNGEEWSLRVSLMTGNRALPLLWFDLKQGELKGKQREVEDLAIAELVRLRPPGVTWVVLLDSGFRCSKRIRLLQEAGYFVLRSDSKTKVHAPGMCWTAIDELGVRTGQVVEFGHVHWARQDPVAVRLVACKLLKLVTKVHLARRRSGAHPSGNTRPGLWPLLTNLPEERFSALAVVRLYARRFECEHNFRDLKSSTLGLDMEHVHLALPTTHERLMCIVAVAAALLWVFGAQAEEQGLAQSLSPSRPKDGRRILSLVRVGSLCVAQIRGSIPSLLRRHLHRALTTVRFVMGRTWVDAVEPRVFLESYAYNKRALGEVPRACAQSHRKLTSRCAPLPVRVIRPVSDLRRRLAA